MHIRFRRPGKGTVRGLVDTQRLRAMLTPEGVRRAEKREVLNISDVKFSTLATLLEGGRAMNQLDPLTIGLLTGAGGAFGAGIAGGLMKRAEQQRNPHEGLSVRAQRVLKVVQDPYHAISPDTEAEHEGLLELQIAGLARSSLQRGRRDWLTLTSAGREAWYHVHSPRNPGTLLPPGTVTPATSLYQGSYRARDFNNPLVRGETVTVNLPEGETTGTISDIRSVKTGFLSSRKLVEVKLLNGAKILVSPRAVRMLNPRSKARKLSHRRR